MSTTPCGKIRKSSTWWMLLVPSLVMAFVPPHALDHSNRQNIISGQPARIGSLSFSLVKHKRRNVRVTALSVDSSSSSSSSSTSSSTPTKDETRQSLKVTRLKDKMWMRDTKEDLTAAEFACSLEPNDDDEEPARKRKKLKRAVDYENLLRKLEGRVMDLCCDDDKSQCNVTLDQDDQLMPSPIGKGSAVYTLDERQALLTRILQTRLALRETMLGHELEFARDEEEFSFELPEIRVDIPKNDTTGTEPDGSLLYVRDDGTVDWDGALQDRAALKKFGTAVWARINGEDPDEVDPDKLENKTDFVEGQAVTVKIQETEAIRNEKKRLDELNEEYREMKAEHTALLNSAISAGQAVANINLATLDPKLRNLIRKSTESLEKMKEEVSFQSLIYEMERIFTYLDGEMNAKGYVPLQDRLNVAEFGLLESQIGSLKSQLDAGEIVDPDVLAVVLEQLTDFKRRLGIDFYVTGLTFDRRAIFQWLNQLGIQARNGLAFYVKGCRLFWNDIVFATSLIGRALRGYTLKPREVRNLRRTVKDIFTFIPVVIILLIPLSPVGHVLVFGAIQRFFPGFFPSCFTESRQNLLQLYESTEYSEVVINETWQEKLSRILEAMAFLTANFVRKLYNKIKGGSDSSSQDESS